MDEETLKFYIQKVEEFVLDDDKIVTYKWLSKTLGVHVNLSKQLLYTFATESYEAKKVGIAKTYFISGMLLDNCGWKVVVVNEDKLEKVKSLFKFITSNHIYSVQKSKNVAAISSFYEVDRFQKDESDKVIPAITCTSAHPRSEFEISDLRSNNIIATPKNDKQLSTSQKKSTTGNKEDLGDGKKPNKEKEEADPVIKKCTKPTTNGSVKKTGSIAAMFATQESKMKTTGNATQPVQVKGKNSKVSQFFSNSKNSVKTTGNDSSITNSVKSLPVHEEEKNNENRESLALSKNKSNSEHEDVHINKKQKVLDTSFDKKNSQTFKEKGGKEKPKKQVKLNKKSKTNEDSEVGKKRKRIVTLESDSSDDDIFEDEEMPDSPPPPEHCPEEMECDDVIPCTPLPKLRPGRKHKRKLIDKTFMDEEGYLITKKEYVVESCSDTDTEKENEMKIDEKVESSITKEVTKSKSEEVTESKNEKVTKSKNEEVTESKNEKVTKSKNEEVTKPNNKGVIKSNNKEPTKSKKKEVKMKDSQKCKQSTLLNFFK